MQLSRPLLILPLFFARRLLLFQRRFFDFLFKAPSFSLSGGFFFVVVVLFFFCSDDDVVWCLFFFFLPFFFAFHFAFFSPWGVSFRQHRRKEKETNEKI